MDALEKTRRREKAREREREREELMIIYENIYNASIHSRNFTPGLILSPLSVYHPLCPLCPVFFFHFLSLILCLLASSRSLLFFYSSVSVCSSLSDSIACLLSFLLPAYVSLFSVGFVFCRHRSHRKSRGEREREREAINC